MAQFPVVKGTKPNMKDLLHLSLVGTSPKVASCASDCGNPLDCVISFKTRGRFGATWVATHLPRLLPIRKQGCEGTAAFTGGVTESQSHRVGSCGLRVKSSYGLPPVDPICTVEIWTR